MLANVESTPLVSAERSLPPRAIALMLMLCLSWGFNQIAVKLALPDIPPFLQGTIRSIAALPVLLLIARFRGVNIFARDGTLYAGLCAGVLFGIEFVLIAGTYTNVCCQASAQDAMMLNFRTIMVSDCNAGSTRQTHAAALNNFFEFFGDVLSVDEVLERLEAATETVAA